MKSFRLEKSETPWPDRLALLWAVLFIPLPLKLPIIFSLVKPVGETFALDLQITVTLVAFAALVFFVFLSKRLTGKYLRIISVGVPFTLFVWMLAVSLAA